MARELITERAPFTPAQLYRRRFGKDLPTTLPVTPAQLEQRGGCAVCHAPVQPGEVFCSKRCSKKDSTPQ